MTVADIVHYAKSAIRGNYVLLSADTLHLLLPQHEVGAAEYLNGVPEAGDEPGLLKLPGSESRRRFAALSAQMTLLANYPRDRFLVTSLDDGNHDLGWCWNTLQILIDVELYPLPIPPVLLTADTPIDHYVEIDGKLAFLCSAHHLSKFALNSRN
jgi:hypothetical protein